MGFAKVLSGVKSAADKTGCEKSGLGAKLSLSHLSSFRGPAHGGETNVHRLGLDLFAGERPQFAVPAHCWQSAMSLGAWTLIGCTVAPGFEFSGFELAPPGFVPCARNESPDGK
ncbi:MAG: cupin domain-containing protein [Beijerinckiaceae bacterium]